MRDIVTPRHLPSREIHRSNDAAKPIARSLARSLAPSPIWGSEMQSRGLGRDAATRKSGRALAGAPTGGCMRAGSR